MTTKTQIKGLALLAFMAMSAGIAKATPAIMVTGNDTNPPIGHYQFCKEFPNQCNTRGQDPGPIALTERDWKTIVKVNYMVNSSVTPMTDQEIYGVEERWTFPKEVGDCEDYVLLKRKLLIKAGFSPADVLITVVLQPNGDGHAVLTVRTDHGDFVLDNMRNKILLWSQTEYTFLKRQSADDARRWVSIEHGDASAVGSLQ